MNIVVFDQEIIAGSPIERSNSKEILKMELLPAVQLRFASDLLSIGNNKVRSIATSLPIEEGKTTR
jgi:hypothetical protein